MKKNKSTKLKKNKKTSTEESPSVELQIKKPMLPLLEGTIDVNLTVEEVYVLANLLTIAATTFQSIALQAAEANQVDLFNTLLARHKLLTVYADKFLSAYKIGEPLSRDVH